MSWDILVRTLYSDSGLSVGLAKANEGLKNLGKTGPQAGVGLRAVEHGVRELAFQAVGLPGPLGRISAGLLQLSGGNALMLGVVAGIAAAGLAIRALTQEARDNAEATKKMTDELDRLGAHGQIVAAQVRIGQLQRRRDEPSFFEKLGDIGKEFISDMTGGAGRTGQIEDINRQIAEQQNIINRARRNLPGVDEGEKAARAAALARGEAEIRRNAAATRAGIFIQGGPQTVQSLQDEEDAVRRLRLEYDKVSPALRAIIIARERERDQMDRNTALLNADTRQRADAEIRNRMLFASEEDVTEALRVQELVLQGFDPAMAKATAANEKFYASQVKTVNVLRSQLPAAFAAMGRAAVTSMDAVVQSAIQSVAQIAQSLPGVSPVESSVIGFLSGIMGGIFSRHRDRGVSIDEYSQKALDQMKQAGGDPDRFTLQIVSATTGEVLDEIVYELGRRTRLDRVIRIPRGVILRS